MRKVFVIDVKQTCNPVIKNQINAKVVDLNTLAVRYLDIRDPSVTRKLRKGMIITIPDENPVNKGNFEHPAFVKFNIVRRSRR